MFWVYLQEPTLGKSAIICSISIRYYSFILLGDTHVFLGSFHVNAFKATAFKDCLKKATGSFLTLNWAGGNSQFCCCCCCSWQNCYFRIIVHWETRRYRNHSMCYLKWQCVHSEMEIMVLFVSKFCHEWEMWLDTAAPLWLILPQLYKYCDFRYECD